ncbi:MAG: lysophospholipid acyltransferase family protein [Opitutaceae bacterium]|nr:lysophospholipid acyltransferase family protein [Opitutaceae bacterium]
MQPVKRRAASDQGLATGASGVALLAVPRPVEFNPDEPDPPFTIAGWRKLAVAPLALLVRAWSASLRFDISPESRERLERTDRPVAFVLWHNRLFLVAEIHRRYRRGRLVYGLVSASKDGAWLEAFFRMVGIRAVRGSSTRGGREAVNALIEKVREGHDIGITPDGPRGPIYEVKGGAAIVARRVHAPIYVMGGQFVASWSLRSWDRFILPKPFSRVRIQCIELDPDALTQRGDAVQALERCLRTINSDAREPERPAQ